MSGCPHRCRCCGSSRALVGPAVAREDLPLAEGVLHRNATEQMRLHLRAITRGAILPAVGGACRWRGSCRRCSRCSHRRRSCLRASRLQMLRLWHLLKLIGERLQRHDGRALSAFFLSEVHEGHPFQLSRVIVLWQRDGGQLGIAGLRKGLKSIGEERLSENRVHRRARRHGHRRRLELHVHAVLLEVGVADKQKAVDKVQSSMRT